MLSEKPRVDMTAKVPISDTGIVTVGMIVARRSWRKIRTVTITRNAAIKSVEMISLIDALTTFAVS